MVSNAFKNIAQHRPASKLSHIFELCAMPKFLLCNTQKETYYYLSSDNLYTMRQYFVIFIFLTVASCVHMKMTAEIINSPSGKYKVEINFNENTSDKTKFNCILLTFYDMDFKEIETRQTGISKFTKWAIAWYPKNDTIILASHDIGTTAYYINKNKQLESIKITKSIDSIAELLIVNKKNRR